MTNSAPQSHVPPFAGHTAGPLSGLVIADLGRVLAGPYCTMLLGDMGATVIKVESPMGDETRSWAPPRYEDESTYFLSVNRNKRSVVLDFGDPDDLVLVKRLLDRADIVTENFKPGGLARFGLDYDSVSATNPGVIFASISGFGEGGGAGLPGYDLLVQALSGMMDLTGSPDTEGYRAGVAVFDVITGLHTTIGILAALHDRDLTGEGQHLQLNLMASALSGMVNQTGGYVLSGSVPRRLGNDHPSIYPYAPFPTAEGDIVLSIGNDAQFRVLCLALGLDGIPDDPRFASNTSRSEHRSELRPLLVDRLAARTAQEWFDELSLLKVPCAPILDVAGGIAFAERIGLDPVVTVGVGDRQMKGIRHPVTFSRTPAAYDLEPPLLDGNRDEVRRWLDADAPATTTTPAEAPRFAAARS
jgi:crotonobetainyl-CoA:carnitine CoA-transferase CaiB-like acyl-CoA transferase